MTIGPILALVISALALVVSILNFIYGRHDKSAERFKQFAERQEAEIKGIQDTHAKDLKSSFEAVTRAEKNVHRRIDDLVKLQNNNEQENLKKLGEIEANLASVNTHLEHIPDRQDIERVTAAVSTLAQSLARVEGALKVNTDTTNRINQFLMEKGS